MLRTLQSYVTRELVKTFALTATGLTLIFSLCGGVLNMIQADVLTALQVARIFMYVLPLALTLTLPVSALFACAMVYGRLAADNEIDACRASGVNIHRILAPALGLSLFTGAFTFVFANYVLPTFVEGLESLVRKDLEQIVVHSLQTRGFIRKGPYVLYARDAALYGEKEDRKIVQIERGAFFELEAESLRTAGTANRARIDFLKPAEGGNPTVEAWLFGVRMLDLKRNQFREEEEQPFAGLEIPNPLKEKPKFLTLTQLVAYRADLTRAVAMREHIDSVRQQVTEAGFYKWVVSQLKDGKSLQLSNAQRQYVIRAAQASNADDMRPELTDVQLTEINGRVHRDYKAEHGTIRLKKAYGNSPPTAQIVLRGKATFADARDPKTEVERREFVLEDIPVPPAALASTASINNSQLLDLPSDPAKLADLGFLLKAQPEPLHLGQRVEDARVKARRELVEFGLDITGIIHSRLAFSASVLVMLVLAAALGIIYRGGQLLTAFVISFIPGLLVVVMNLAGRQLAEKYPTHLPGIIVIWAAIGIVAIADAIVLTRYLKR